MDRDQPHRGAWIWVLVPVVVASGVVALGLTIAPERVERRKRRAPPERIVVVDDVEQRAIEEGAVFVLEAAKEASAPTPVEAAPVAAEAIHAAAVREVGAPPPPPAEARVIAEAPAPPAHESEPSRRSPRGASTQASTARTC